VPTGTRLCAEGHVKKILLIIFFVQLSKREMRPHNACLHLPQMRDARKSSVSPFAYNVRHLINVHILFSSSEIEQLSDLV
jgi:hypothetical protein